MSSDEQKRLDVLDSIYEALQCDDPDEIDTAENLTRSLWQRSKRFRKRYATELIIRTINGAGIAEEEQHDDVTRAFAMLRTLALWSLDENENEQERKVA